ncbi:hypothetical protein [Listeria rustica]|uniref:Uncharacterized protein n=1 Tax=Listeria rustica TaxID=2713503 RepID=A0A7W1YFI1_9LIST|nr:hypothetical protein [Listeria rustica]MBA3925651.1 hypothetical protein [Listeria rustica]
MTSNMEESFVNETATKFAYEPTWVAASEEMIREKLSQAETDFATGNISTWEEVKSRVAILTDRARAESVTEWE